MIPTINTVALRKAHHELKTWPLTRNDVRAASDGYLHVCRACGDPWPCAISLLLDRVARLEAVKERMDSRIAELSAPNHTHVYGHGGIHAEVANCGACGRLHELRNLRRYSEETTHE